MKFTLGQKVKRNPAHFKKSGRPAPQRVGIVISDAFDTRGKPVGYKVDWQDGDWIGTYMPCELIAAK